MNKALVILSDIAVPVDVAVPAEMRKLIASAVGTKMTSVWSDMMCTLAYTAVKCVATTVNGKMEVDVKRYARVEKV